MFCRHMKYPEEGVNGNEHNKAFWGEWDVVYILSSQILTKSLKVLYVGKVFLFKWKSSWIWKDILILLSSSKKSIDKFVLCYFSWGFFWCLFFFLTGILSKLGNLHQQRLMQKRGTRLFRFWAKIKMAFLSGLCFRNTTFYMRIVRYH